jgi:IS5 family transposase
VASGKPVVVFLRPGKTPSGREVRAVLKHLVRRIRRHCQSPVANQVRLVLHTAAYWLMLGLRDTIPTASPLAKAEFTTLRFRLLKLGARVVEKVARIRIHFASAYKNHISTDRRHGLIRKWDVSDAAANDGKRLKVLLDKQNTASSVWADTAYRSKTNEAFMAKTGFRSQVHHKKPPRRALPETLARANAKRSKVRAAVEHVFAHQKDRMGLLVRTIGLKRARLKIGMVNLAYNMTRFLWLRGRTAPA